MGMSQDDCACGDKVVPVRHCVIERVVSKKHPSAHLMLHMLNCCLASQGTGAKDENLGIGPGRPLRKVEPNVSIGALFLVIDKDLSTLEDRNHGQKHDSITL